MNSYPTNNFLSFNNTLSEQKQQKQQKMKPKSSSPIIQNNWSIPSSSILTPKTKTSITKQFNKDDDNATGIPSHNGILRLVDGILENNATVLAGSDVCGTLPTSVIKVNTNHPNILQWKNENSSETQWYKQLKLECVLYANKDSAEPIPCNTAPLQISRDLIDNKPYEHIFAIFNMIQIYKSVKQGFLRFILHYNDQKVDYVDSAKFNTITNKGKMGSLKRKRESAKQDVFSIEPSSGPKKGYQTAKIYGYFLPLSLNVTHYDVFFSTKQAQVILVMPEYIEIVVPEYDNPMVPDDQDVSVAVTIIQKSPKLPGKRRRTNTGSAMGMVQCESVRLSGDLKYLYQGKKTKSPSNQTSTLNNQESSTPNSFDQLNHFNNSRNGTPNFNSSEFLIQGASDSSGNNILHFSSCLGFDQLCIKLLNQTESPFNINSKNNFGITPLMYAATSNLSHLVRHAVEDLEGNWWETDNCGSNIFHYIAQGQSVETAETLLNWFISNGSKEDQEDVISMISEETNVKGFTPIQTVQQEMEFNNNNNNNNDAKKTVKEIFEKFVHQNQQSRIASSSLSSSASYVNNSTKSNISKISSLSFHRIMLQSEMEDFTVEGAKDISLETSSEDITLSFILPQNIHLSLKSKISETEIIASYSTKSDELSKVQLLFDDFVDVKASPNNKNIDLNNKDESTETQFANIMAVELQTNGKEIRGWEEKLKQMNSSIHIASN